MRKSKRQSNKNALLGVFGLVIICGISQAIITSQTSLKTALIGEQGISSQLTQTNATTSLVVAHDSYPEGYLSNGDRVIKTKTAYFENEVQVWLASDEACKYHGLDNDSCRNSLMGMAYAEHRDFSKTCGDSCKSKGVFQINQKYHPEITDDQANDTYFAAKWTLGRMIKLGYKTNPEYAIRSHNGNPTQPQTLPYIASVNKYISM